MRFVFFILLSVLFLSCNYNEQSTGDVSGLNQDKSLSIQDITNQWIDLEQLFKTYDEYSANMELESLIEASEVFCLSLQKFQESGLFHIYRAIPFSSETERSLNPHHSTEIQEVALVSDMALIFHNSIVLGNLEEARSVSSEISSFFIRLLLIDRETQQFIG